MNIQGPQLLVILAVLAVLALIGFGIVVAAIRVANRKRS